MNVYGEVKKFLKFQEHVQICGDVILRTFDELTVRLTLDSTNLQHRKLVFQLVKPSIPGVSYTAQEQVEKMEIVEIDKKENEKKRKESKGGKNKKKKYKK